MAVSNSTCPPTVCLPNNKADFALTNLVFDPNDGDKKRRFHAFWVPGDGNYLLFDPALDSLSMRPSYFYSAAGTYEAAAYLTGKYTNRKPPARAVQSVPIGALAPNAPRSAFKSRLGKLSTDTVPALDVFADHDIRKKYLTTFVISWPGNVNASGIFLFFNGFKHSRTGAYNAFSSPALRYERTDVPRYFSGLSPAGAPLFNAAKIKAHPSADLQVGGTVDGLSFSAVFANSMRTAFGRLVYYPSETATINNMPPDFTENRLFPVLWADSTFVPQDSFMNFYVLLVGPKPVSGNGQLNEKLAALNPDLVPGNPVAFTQQQQPLYIQAVADLQLQYLTTFDPNQLTVEGVKKMGADDFEVTFRLEMCNKGRGIVEQEDISLTFPSMFQNFVPLGFNPVNSNLTANSWDFRSNMTIPGVEPDSTGHEESVCASIQFSARTNCTGLRSLWKSADPAPVQACVVFNNSLVNHPECHAATPIDSTQFGCLCCNSGSGTKVDGADSSWLLWLLLILVVLFAIWWANKNNSH